MKPIDLQTSIPRTTEVGRVARVRDEQAAVQHHQEAAGARHRAEESKRRVLEPHSGQEVGIGPDGGRRQRGGRQDDAGTESRESQDNPRQESGSGGTTRGGNLDLRI